MKVYRNIIVLFLFNFLIFNQLLSQNSEVILYSGRVVNEKNQPLNYAHVLIVNQFIGTITNETGNFFLPVNAKDTLIFRYLGYINDTIIIPDTLQSPFFSNIIRLQPGSLTLRGVTIRPYPKDADELKKAIINFGEKEEYADLEHMFENEVFFPAPEPGTGFGVTVPGPISLLWELFSREAKQRREYNRLVQKDIEQAALEKRVNRELLKKITGLTSDADIDSFIAYCGIAGYLKLKPIDYDLYMMIMDCFKKYRGRQTHPQN